MEIEIIEHQISVEMKCARLCYNANMNVFVIEGNIDPGLGAMVFVTSRHKYRLVASSVCGNIAHGVWDT